ncbi:MAG: nitroreductase family protein [Paracoccaceae bacterium]
MNRRNALIGASGLVLLAGAGALGWRAATGSAADYDAQAMRLRAPLPPHPEIADLIRYATLAANGHNTQPWRFRAEGGAIEILPDLARATPVVDPDDHHLFVSLGCAVENLAIAGAVTGRPGTVEVSADGIRYAFGTAAPQDDPLRTAITQRQSTRALYDGQSLPAGDIGVLRRAAERSGVRAVFLTERARIDDLRDLVVAGNDAQMADPAFIAELKQWLRFSRRSAMASGDGLFSGSSGNPALPDALGRRAFDLVFTARAENDKYARQIDSSAGIVVFLADRTDKAHWIEVGRACQRFALTATALGLKHAFVNQPVEVAPLRPELAALVGEPSLRPDIVMRFGRGPVLPFSLRRPVARMA